MPYPVFHASLSDNISVRNHIKSLILFQVDKKINLVCDYNDFIGGITSRKKKKGQSKGRNNKKAAISTRAAEESGDEYLSFSFGDP